MNHLGFAGKIARAFINSKLTPLIVGASLLLGLFAIKMTPREEEPQIVVPMVDIYLPMPGSISTRGAGAGSQALRREAVGDQGGRVPLLHEPSGHGHHHRPFPGWPADGRVAGQALQQGHEQPQLAPSRRRRADGGTQVH